MSQEGIVDIVSSTPSIPTTFEGNTGAGAVPVLNTLNIYGDLATGITTDATGMTVTISGINATAAATVGAAQIGVSAFDNASFVVTNGFVQLAAGALGVLSVETDDGAPNVEPDGDGEIQILGGQSIGVTGQGPGNTVTVAADIATYTTLGVASFNSADFTVTAGAVSLIGGSMAIDSVALQAGTSPIVPTVAGLITFNGSYVAQGTVPVQTRGTGANTMQLEVQIAQTVGSADVTKIGLSNFNSAQFTVSPEGFVSAIGSTATDYHVARYIVSAGGATDGAEYTTIADAYAAAVTAGAPQDVFIQPGTYTENITGVPGINLVAFANDAMTSSFTNVPSPTVTIVGTMTFTAAGEYNLTGIMFKTNGATAISSTGSSSIRVNFNSCGVWAFDAVGMTCTNSNTNFSYYNSFFCNDTTNTFFAGTNGSCVFNWTKFNGSSTTATSTVGEGTYQFNNCNVSGLQVTTSSTGKITAFNSRFTYGNTNILTMAGTGTSEIHNCSIESGTASACSIGAGCTLNITNTRISSSNAAVITGAGTVNYGGLTFTSTSSTINATTQARLSEGPSRTIGSSNSGGTNNQTITNTSNTASSNALSQITVAGTSAGDPFQTFTITGTTNWSQGPDNSVTGDPFKLSASASLGTTDTLVMTTAGEMTLPLQPAFQARLSASTASDKTGNGTTYTLICDTETFDQGGDYNNGTGVFEAPVTGRYRFNARLAWNGVTTQNSYTLLINTSNRQYSSVFSAVIFTGLRQNACEFCDMDAGDTCTLQALGTGQGADTVGFIGSAGNAVTYFAGNLEC